MSIFAKLRHRHWRVSSGRLRVVTLAVGILTFLGAAAYITIAWATALPDNAVFRLGDEVVTTDQFDRRVQALRGLYGVQPPEGGAERERFNRDAAKSIAVGMILERAAAERGIVIADRSAQRALAKTIAAHPQGTDAFDEYLAAGRISQDTVIAEMKRQLATARLFEQITKNVPKVTDAEVRKEFAENRRDMVTPEKRRLRNIVVTSEEEAKQVLRMVQDGAGFASLAKRYSLDASTRDSGGDLGARTRDELDPTFAKEAFAASPRAAFGPVRSQHGWNVGQVVSIEPGSPLSLDSVARRLKQEMQSGRELNAWRRWLAEQIEAAEVEYADAYRPSNPEAPPSDGPPGDR